MADKLNLEVITPERRVLSEAVDEVVVPGLGGELGILPEHTPLISQLQTGVLVYRQGADRKQLHVSGGFVEVQPDRVSVLSDVAEKPEEIDLERAQRAKEQAERELKSQGEDVDFRSAEQKLQRALTRIQLAGKG
ncbi:MAG TPA: F0F1 ATP synthase subunit epsilon [Blastocatellia bacterium]|nr:F0F1 ATP synthase subunit epsilon [Blastocatellia bacterium]HMV82603.1 F0F1 ATP synthase subunit epsilon [Blastocatellia bacterium]HMY75012.1 F0F1 ATP synthase subunit epsilon [Blastocatellia bacterium]HMZ18656.1 F0F1 ATP synthase subunit epsilon [Blastocatellia bacterium]HNG32943.1 F0F1 ATP synthase subunit epsilon [Blastocatellia bacterium]